MEDASEGLSVVPVRAKRQSSRRNGPASVALTSPKRSIICPLCEGSLLEREGALSFEVYIYIYICFLSVISLLRLAVCFPLVSWTFPLVYLSFVCRAVGLTVACRVTSSRKERREGGREEGSDGPCGR